MISATFLLMPSHPFLVSEHQHGPDCGIGLVGECEDLYAVAADLSREPGYRIGDSRESAGLARERGMRFWKPAFDRTPHRDICRLPVRVPVSAVARQGPS